MLKLLLDEHISCDIADGLRRQNKGITVHCLPQWEAGRLIGQTDELLLKQAALHKLTLVTYDLRTIPPLLKLWAEAGKDHGGVIFVDHKTIPPSDFGGMVRALQKLHHEGAKWDWKNRICFLRR